KENWRENRPYEDEKSTRMLLSTFHSLPRELYQAGKYFSSRAIDFQNPYSVRTWVEFKSPGRWSYHERTLFPVTKGDNRPAETQAPAPITVATDVLIWNGEAYFINKTGTFSLNANYSPDALKRRKSSFRFSDDTGGPLVNIVWPILSLLGFVFSV